MPDLTEGQRLEQEKQERLLKRQMKNDKHLQHKHANWMRRKLKRLTKNKEAKRINKGKVNTEFCDIAMLNY
jgi:16S rRNA C967 or C1407 C5-methylase (RsmB/RsmF family)